jgi:hypothetical protein
MLLVCLGSDAENLANQKLTNSLAQGGPRWFQLTANFAKIRTKRHYSTSGGTHNQSCGIPASAPIFWKPSICWALAFRVSFN